MPSQIGASLANLLWLIPVPAGARAGCVGRVNAPIVRAMALHFPGLRTDSPFPDGSLDFVAGLYGGALATSEVHEAARILAPGGTALLIGAANRKIGEAWRLRRTASAAGFTDLRTYHIAGSLDEPMDVIPHSRAALMAHARWTAPAGVKGLARRAAIQVGVLPRGFTGLALTGRRP